MTKRTVIGISAIIAAIIAIIVIIMYFGPINLVDLITGLLLLIIGSAITAAYWTLRPYIHKSIESPSPSHQEPSNTYPQVTKVVGHPDTISKEGTQRYNRRSHLPFDELLSEAKERVDMLAITFHMVTTANIKLIEETIYRNVIINFSILNPSSRHIETMRDYFHEGSEVRHHIERSLEVLCGLKKGLPDGYRDKLIIKTYDDAINNSVIIIDQKLIKIELYVRGSDSDSRPNDLAFRDDNRPFYALNSYTYDKIKSTNYNCLKEPISSHV